MTATGMKVILSILILVIAMGTQLDFQGGQPLVDRSAVVSLPLQTCYQKISDISDFPKWMSMITGAESVDFASSVHVGTEFVTLFNMGLLGPLEQKNIVVSMAKNAQFSFTIDNTGMVLTELKVAQTSESKCRITLVIRTRRSSIFFLKLVAPFMRVYYSNWATHSLMNLKIQT